MTSRKRSGPGKKSISAKWQELYEATVAEAESLPHGRAREVLMKKARQLKTACQMESWIASPGLKPPANDLIDNSET